MNAPSARSLFLGASLSSVLFVAPALAAEPTSVGSGGTGSNAATAESDVLEVAIGQSMIRREGRPVSRILASDPEIIELRALESGQYQLRGLAVGTTDLWVWYQGDGDKPRRYQVSVYNAQVDEVRARIAALSPENPPRVYALQDRMVVEGTVPDLQTLEQIVAIARIYDEEFVNLVSVAGDSQVQLKVVFAEVNRTAMRELGFNFYQISPYGDFSLMPPITGGNGDINMYKSGIRFPTVNDAVLNSPGTEGFTMLAAQLAVGGGNAIYGMINVLEQNSLSRTLAEPTVVALSGQKAEFLAGGEIPVPVGQSNGTISIDFKDYGIKLVSVPTVLAGNVIDVSCFVEVSNIDPGTSLQAVGIEIPGISVARSQTHLRIGDGMTFAVAGLLYDNVAASRSHVPILGEIPIIGSLFRYVRHERSERELVIFVTPHLVRPMAPEEVPPAPGTTEAYNPNDFELFLMGNLTRPGSRTAEPTGTFGMER